ncbi:MAG TPA: PLP-dependent aminotransferase family protein [Fimbriimonadaceae bacterium]|nr:PLP-dependent aminotransferase family protein [Fimbriimonadaceae bacterium]
MDILLNREGDVPLYRQIVEQIQSQILSSRLAPGLRLPPVRDLAEQLDVSVPTALRAYSELREIGLIGSAVGSGTFVSEPSARWAGIELLKTIRVQGPINLYEPLSTQTGIRSLATAVSDPRLFHGDDFVADIRDAASSSPWAFYYAPPAGAPELLREGAALLGQRGINPGDDELLVGPGSRASLGLVLQALGEPDDLVLMEDPAYLGAPMNLQSMRFRRHYVPVDESGTLDLEQAEAAIAQHRPRFLLLRPAFGNCIGALWSPAKTARLLELVRKEEIILIECDDSCRMAYRVDPPPPLSLQFRGKVQAIYIEPLDDSLSPAVRTSFLWAPSDLRNRILFYSRSMDLSNPNFMQVALAKFMDKGGMKAHLRRVIPRFQLNRDTLVSSLRREMPREVLWREPLGGLSVWVELPKEVDPSNLYEQALEAGVAFAPGWMFREGPHAPSGFRLSFGMASQEGIREAVAILGRLIRARMD